MLHDVKIRSLDLNSRVERHEIITVDADSGDGAAELALAIRPGAVIVGIGPKGCFGPYGGPALEADDEPAAADEDAEPGPSKRELAESDARSRPPRARKPDGTFA